MPCKLSLWTRSTPPSCWSPPAARQLVHAIRTARFKGSVHRSGEPIATIGTLPLDHPWHRFPRLRVHRPRRCFCVREPPGPQHSSSRLLLVCQRLASFFLLLWAQSMVVCSSNNCLSRLANASRSISAMGRASIRSRSTGLKYAPCARVGHDASLGVAIERHGAARAEHLLAAAPHCCTGGRCRR